MTVTVRHSVAGALNARADDLVRERSDLSCHNRDNVFPGAAPEDQADPAGAAADGALHPGHQPQARQAREDSWISFTDSGKRVSNWTQSPYLLIQHQNC